MATNKQNEQEKQQTISDEELNDVTGGYGVGWTDEEGQFHWGARPPKPQGVV